MAGYRKIGTYTRYETKNNLPYEVIYQIAEMRVVQKMTPAEISRALNVPYKLVYPLIVARKQTDLWLEAIASLARQGLIHD